MDPYGLHSPLRDLLVPHCPGGLPIRSRAFYNLFDQQWSYMVMYCQPLSCVDLPGPLWDTNDSVLSQNKDTENYEKREGNKNVFNKS